MALELLWLAVWIFLSFTITFSSDVFSVPMTSNSELAFCLEQEKDMLEVVSCQASGHRQVVPPAAQGTPRPSPSSVL